MVSWWLVAWLVACMDASTGCRGCCMAPERRWARSTRPSRHRAQPARPSRPSHACCHVLQGFSADEAAAAADAAGNDANRAAALIMSGAVTVEPGAGNASRSSSSLAPTVLVGGRRSDIIEAGGGASSRSSSSLAPTECWAGDAAAAEPAHDWAPGLETPPASETGWAAGLQTPAASENWAIGAAYGQPPPYGQPAALDHSAAADAAGSRAASVAQVGWLDVQAGGDAAAAQGGGTWLPPAADRLPPPEEEIDELLAMLGIA